MNNFKKSLTTFLSLFIILSVDAQEATNADIMRSNGKIYVVVAIIVTILTGLFLYVASIDRKLTRLEKEQIKK